MELFTKLFGDLLVLVYHCFDRMVIHGYRSGFSRPAQVVYFFRPVLGAPVGSQELLSQRTHDYQSGVEAYARNHHLPIEWAEKGVRQEDPVLPWLRRMALPHSQDFRAQLRDRTLAAHRSQNIGNLRHTSAPQNAR